MAMTLAFELLESVVFMMHRDYYEEVAGIAEVMGISTAEGLYQSYKN
jgi:hypothetical protein